MQIQAIASTAVPVTTTQSDAGTTRASAPLVNLPSNAATTTATQQVAPAGKTEAQPSVEESVKKLNDMATSVNANLQFSVDPSTKMEVVKVVDSSTNEVIRQIPSQEAIDIAKAINKFQGLLVRDKA